MLRNCATIPSNNTGVGCGSTLLAIDQFLVPQIVTLPFDQVERDQHDVMITATAPQGIEI